MNSKEHVKIRKIQGLIDCLTQVLCNFNVLYTQNLQTILPKAFYLFSTSFYCKLNPAQKVLRKKGLGSSD